MQIQQRPPSQLLKAVFDEHCRQYGEPTMHYAFPPALAAGECRLDPLDVFIWRATPECPVSTFSTIGMSDRAMPGAEHRAEIHLSVRGGMSPNEEQALAVLLANLAIYPFRHEACFDWFHLWTLGRPLPVFSRCRHGLFHPALSPDGWDQMRPEGERVKILNFIPLTDEEHERAREESVDALLNFLYARGVDIFSDRIPTSQEF